MAHGDTRIIPMELQETIYPYRYEELSLRGDSGGPGRFRGGMGFRKRYRIMAECVLRTNLDRTACEPWGVCGGMPGAVGSVIVIRDGETEGVLANKADDLVLHRGDQVLVLTGGGGGYGPPAERAIADVERDVRRGYVSRENALNHYGVRVGPDSRGERAPVAARTLTTASQAQ
jgi:N-methylhydantoinase B